LVNKVKLTLVGMAISVQAGVVWAKVFLMPLLLLFFTPPPSPVQYSYFHTDWGCVALVVMLQDRSVEAMANNLDAASELEVPATKLENEEKGQWPSVMSVVPTYHF
jgi:hypothetical protein